MKSTLGITLAVAGLTASGIALNSREADASSALVETQPTGEFAVDNSHSTVLFGVDYSGVARFYGRFNKVSGSYLLDLENPSASSLSITVDAESVDTANADRDKHLRNPDFFAAREYPSISFTGKQFTKVDSETIRVTGDLEFRGKTEQISVDLNYFGDGTDLWSNNRSGFEGTFTIDRSEFGSTYGIGNGALGADVDLTVAITGVRK